MAFFNCFVLSLSKHLYSVCFAVYLGLRQNYTLFMKKSGKQMIAQIEIARIERFLWRTPLGMRYSGKFSHPSFHDEGKVYLVLFVIPRQGIHNDIYPKAKGHFPLPLSSRNHFVFPRTQRVFRPRAAEVIV